jgi:hypothetical protein
MHRRYAIAGALVLGIPGCSLDVNGTGLGQAPVGGPGPMITLGDAATGGAHEATSSMSMNRMDAARGDGSTSGDAATHVVDDASTALTGNDAGDDGTGDDGTGDDGAEDAATTPDVGVSTGPDGAAQGDDGGTTMCQSVTDCPSCLHVQVPCCAHPQNSVTGIPGHVGAGNGNMKICYCVADSNSCPGPS